MSQDREKKNPLEYISLAEASRESGYTPEYLNSLARKGKLKAKKIGRNWHTTLAWFEDFTQTTKAAKKEKIEKLDSKIQDYENGKAEIPEEVPTPAMDEVFAVSPITNEKLFVADKFSEKTETRFRRRWKRANTFAATLVAGFLLLGLFQAGRIINLNIFGGGGISENFPADNSGSDAYSKWISADDGGVVKAAEITNANSDQQNGAALVSENFKITEIKFGGAIAMASASENPNLEISDIRSEVLKTNGKEESQLLITWQTNKLAMSTIEYSPMNGSNTKKLMEVRYGFGHSVVLNNLEPGTAYVYVIKAKDKWANEISSDRYSAYIGSKVFSVFELIVQAIKDVFGWAVKE